MGSSAKGFCSDKTVGFAHPGKKSLMNSRAILKSLKITSTVPLTFYVGPEIPV